MRVEVTRSTGRGRGPHVHGACQPMAGAGRPDRAQPTVRSANVLAGFKTAVGCIAGLRELFCSDSPRRPGHTLCNQGGSRVERSMTKADEFREYAEEALRWS